jgi:hypothetical protein
MSKRALLIFAGVALVVAAWWAASGSNNESEARSDPAVASAPGAQPSTRASAGRGGRSDDGSWAVTVSDAMGLTLDASRLFELGFGGGLVIDGDTRASIEAVVNALPPEPDAQDMERLERTLRAGLPKDEAEKAYKLITNYRDYARDVPLEMMPLGPPKNREEAKAFFDQMDLVKRRYFDGNTAEALFGLDDRYARLSTEAGFVQQDEALTVAQKKAALEALRAQLPADKRDAIIPLPEPVASPPAS